MFLQLRGKALLLHGGLYHQLEDAAEVLADVVGHAAFQPAGHRSVQDVGSEVDDGLPILPRKVHIPQDGVDVADADGFTVFHQITIKDVPVDGIVDVVGSPAVLPEEGKRFCHALLQRGEGFFFPDEAPDLLVDDLLHQGRKVGIVIIEAVAIDTACRYDVLHGDLMEGPLLQKLQENPLDLLLHKACHAVIPPDLIFDILPQHAQKRNLSDEQRKNTEAGSLCSLSY